MLFRSMETLKKTPLQDLHLQSGARMVPFAGYEMPIQYSGIIHEHETARNGAVLFDTCHMGELHVAGTEPVPDLERLVTCPVEDLAVGKCRYGLMCNEQGGVVDDLLIYRLARNEFMLVVNAGTTTTDLNWIQQHLSKKNSLRDLSKETAKIDLQGPLAPRCVQRIVDMPVHALTYFSFMKNRFRGEEILLSRTGYTGEVGFEVYCTAETARRFWQACLAEGAEPAGLGARDTLRLEMGMPLYGHELNQCRNAAETGFQQVVASTKEWIGRDAVVQYRRDVHALLSGLQVRGRRSARQGDIVVDADDTKVGEVTSASFAPSLGRAVALAYVQRRHAIPGKGLFVNARSTILETEVVELPFYKQGTARKKLKRFL